MPIEVIMPKVDMDMASGKVMVWHVVEGEAVAKGDPLFDIETDKAAMEVESPGDGILHHTAPEGAEIPIGTPCAWLYAEGEEVGAQPVPFAGTGAPETAAVATETTGTGDTAGDNVTITPETVVPDVGGNAAPHDKTRATPLARALAAENGLDIASLAGSGPRNRVQADDVRAGISAQGAPVAVATTSGIFQTETGALSVTRSKGGSGTPVVMIHGFASDATSWAPLEVHLKHRPVIRIDLPSHGKSPKLQIDSFADLVREVRRAFDELGLEAAHLIGHSLGGAISIALADTRPRLLSSLTLIAPAGLGAEINGTALAGICRANRADSLGPWLRALVANEDIITDSYVRLAMASRNAPNLRAAQNALSDIVFPDGVQAFDLRGALERIDAPTRIIWGKSDAIIPWKHALRAPGRMAMHLFGGIGHMPHIECPDEVASILKSYI